MALIALVKIDSTLANLFSEPALIDPDKEVREAARFIRAQKSNG